MILERLKQTFRNARDVKSRSVMEIKAVTPADMSLSPNQALTLDCFRTGYYTTAEALAKLREKMQNPKLAYSTVRKCVVHLYENQYIYIVDWVRTAKVPEAVYAFGSGKDVVKPFFVEVHEIKRKTEYIKAKARNHAERPKPGEPAPALDFVSLATHGPLWSTKSNASS